jgi:hypothetical protein
MLKTKTKATENLKMGMKENHLLAGIDSKVIFLG